MGNLLRGALCPVPIVPDYCGVDNRPKVIGDNCHAAIACKGYPMPTQRHVLHR
jgi:hypothetical protein